MTAQDLYPPALLALAKGSPYEGRLESKTHSARCTNPLCGDRVTLDLVVSEQRIVEFRFEARGCAIAQASCAAMGNQIAGLSTDEAMAMGKNLESVLKGADGALDGLEVLRGVAGFPTRIGCATLAWQALAKCLIPPQT